MDITKPSCSGALASFGPAPHPQHPMQEHEAGNRTAPCLMGKESPKGLSAPVELFIILLM